MKKEIFKIALKRIGIICLILALLLFGLPFEGMLPTAHAADANRDGLTSNSDTLKEAGAFGFSTAQPPKLDPQGNPVDKTKNNPLGASTTSINRILNLAVSGYQMNGTNKGLNTYANASNSGFIGDSGNIVPASASTRDFDYNNDVKAMTAADLNADGRQENVTLVLYPSGTNKCIPSIIVRNYNIDANKKSNGSEETSYQLDSAIPMPASTWNYRVEYPIGIVAGDFNHDGKDELAAYIGNTVYTCKSDGNFKLSTVSKYTFTMPSKPLYGSQITLTSADANNDGFDELLVTTASSADASQGENNPALLIYSSDSLYSKWEKINLSFIPGVSKSRVYLTTPGVDVGDVLGDGNKKLVVGGKASDGKIYVATANYDPEKNSYSSDLSDSNFEIGFAGKNAGHNPSNMWGVLNNASLNLKCVNLTAPTPGTPQWMVLGGSLYQFDKSNGKFVKREVKSRTYASTGAFPVSPGNSDGLLDINCDGDGIGKDGSSFILNTVVGNFNGNKEGKEQIVMLHYDNLNNFMGNGMERVVITYCSSDKDGNISTLNTSIRPVNTPYQNPAISAPDVSGNSTKLIYQPEKSSFVFSKPNVIAVLGAAPYYQEIANRNDDYASNLGNASTSLGHSSESGSSTTNGLNVNVGMSVGFEQEQSILGVVTVAKEEFEASVSYAFTSTWTSSQSVSTGITYQNNMSMRGNDSVVVMVVPCDIFSYKVVGPSGETTEMTINVPYEPQTVQMPISRYNQIITDSKIEGAPVIDPSVLNHTPGDPRTYPKTMSELPGAKTGALLSSSKSVDWGTDFQSVQNIEVTTSQEKSFEHNLDISLSVSLSVFGATAKATTGTGYIRAESKTSSKSTEVTGTVRGLPEDFTKNGYGFNWQLAFYNHDLEVPGLPNPQTCYVVSYLVNPQSSSGYPPYIPQNLKVSSQGQDSVSLMWDKVSNSTGYRISRSETEEGTYEKIKDIEGSATTSFTDITVKSGKTYYYKVRAYNVSDGLDSDAVSGYSIPVSGITVASPPKLSYLPGDKLDLSSLSASLIFSDNSIKAVSFKDFAENNLTVSSNNGVELNASNDGGSIIVTYAPVGSKQYITASAGKLSVCLVKDVELTTLPKLYYTAGDSLDLSQLTIALIYNNNTRKDVSFIDFAANSLTVNSTTSKVLDVSGSGTSLSVTYNGVTSSGQPIVLSIGKLTIYKSGENGVLLSADFTVGGQKNSRTLTPNQQLTANIKVTNTQEEAQDALVLMVLYNEAGSMVKMASGTVTVGARSGTGATKPISLNLTLPKDTNDSYKVRVFAWDGTNFPTTKQVPVSNILQMP